MGFISKAKIIIRRVKGASFQRMQKNIQAIHKETGKSKAGIFTDMLWCTAKYGIGYLDYHVFGFATNKGKNRKTFMTMHHNIGLTRLVNDTTLYPIMNDKLQFMEVYRDFVGRDWVDLQVADAAQLRALCQKSGTVFAKPVAAFGGTGVERIETNESTDFDALYKRLQDGKQFLVEQAVIQHDELNRLCPSSVNTLRIVTLNTTEKSNFLYALLRVGSGDNYVDNISSGGMYTLISDDGTLHFPAFCDKTGLYYDEHPVTHTKYQGFTIPMFREAVDICLKAAQVKPGLAYIGWDVAITPDGPVLIEGNILPGYDMAQNAKFHPDGKGLLPTVEAILGYPVPKA